MNNFKIKATVITPVSIGSGIQLSPYKDYFISNNKVHYVDENKLSQLVAKDPALMDTYDEGVANMDGNRSNFDLKGFVQNHLSMDPFDLVRNSIEFRGNSNAKLPINEAIKTPTGQPYIPGKRWKEDFNKQLEHIKFNIHVTEWDLQQKPKEQ